MANFKIDRLRYTWKGQWVTSTQYKRDDVVGIAGATFVCLKQHASAEDFYIDLANRDLANNIPDPYWVQMTDGVVISGDWEPSTTYNIGQIVDYENSKYVSLINHESALTFELDIDKWAIYSNQIKYRAYWQSSETYIVDDIVLYQGSAYKCVVSHTASATFEADLLNWEIYNHQILFRASWEADTFYKTDAVVTYNGSVFICNTTHTSNTEIEDDIEKWDIYNEQVLFRQDWQAETKYVVNNVVRYNGIVYVCIETHVSRQDFELDIEKWKSYHENIFFRQAWQPETKYVLEDVVVVNGIVYGCINTHISSIQFLNDYSNWEIYHESVEFKQDWERGFRYQLNDIVVYGGIVYQCTTAHLALNDFETDIGFWEVYNLQTRFRQEWQPFTVYVLEDLVTYGGVVYKCIESYIPGDIAEGETESSIFSDNVDKWEIFSKQIRWRYNWSTDTQYVVEDLVKYGGIVYRCIEEHGSAMTYGVPDSSIDGLEADQSKWEIYFENIEFKSTYEIPFRYKVNDLVLYRGSLLRCIEGYLSGGEFDDTKWIVEAQGSSFQNEWNSLTFYGIGSVVKHGGFIYYGLSSNFDHNPSASVYVSDGKWKLLSKGIRYRGLWSFRNQYKTGDIVVRGGNLYVALVDTVVAADGSSLDYLDDSNWELLVDGLEWKGVWQSNQNYTAGDVVKFLGSTFEANLAHTSSEENRPDAENLEGSVWTLLILGQKGSALQQQGDILVYDGELEKPVALSKGSENQVLVITDGAPIHRTWGPIERLRYVGVDGVDDPDDPVRGISPFSPWKTIRFAAEQIDDGFEGTTTIQVLTGRYEEVLPIIVPARTAIKGAELRSTEVIAKSANPLLEGDSEYTIEILNRISSILPNLLTNQAVEFTSGNPLFQEFDGPVASADAIEDIQDLISDIINYIDFHINDEGTEPELVGTNKAETLQGYANAVTALDKHRRILEEEAVAYMKLNYPAYNFDPALCKRDVRAYINAWKYDIIYTGNYKSLLAGRYYRNAVLGSEKEDMFYLRDATGVRLMSIKGLKGEFTTNDLTTFRKVSGGAFCSLDPGWGPDDDRTWINTRSPYIQNITTFGKCAIGQKIDGTLHNGGNKSIVSNDFTQVISDGIGAWVNKDGRAELVSVFTYYAEVGYLATDGGTVRSANGNNSYGRFGALAIGVDDNEVSVTATVNTKLNVPQITSALSSNNGEIQLFQFDNLGKFYTQAALSIRGSGVNAQAEFTDFRDDAVFEARIIDNSDDPVIQAVGGAGYLQARGGAQVNPNPGQDLTSIRIAATDLRTIAEYEGMRLIITAGTGSGQYGRITEYDVLTKIVSITRESNGAPGWDNVVPGTPPVEAFDNSTRYSIEPGLVFTGPGFDPVEFTIPSANTNWGSITYGEIRSQFQAVPATLEFRESNNPQQIFQQVTFSVINNQRSYEISIDTEGTGYYVNDIIVISGEDLGGTSPENDIRLRIVEIDPEGGFDRITKYSIISGQGVSGVYVVTPADGDQGLYSTDGETWSSFTLPSTGNWSAISNKDGTFVTVKKASNEAATSSNGINWTAVTLPTTGQWTSIAQGNGVFVVVSETNSIALYSEDGQTWDENELPSIDEEDGDWVNIAYGGGKFIAAARTFDDIAISTDGETWETGFIFDDQDGELTSPVSASKISITYGNNRFIIMSTSGQVSYSLDGVIWNFTTVFGTPTVPVGIDITFTGFEYGQGVFLATCFGNNGNIFKSEDGVYWTTHEMTVDSTWNLLAFGNPYVQQFDSTTGKSTPRWVILTSDSNTYNKVRTGAVAKGRVRQDGQVISGVLMWDPGSGYEQSPTVAFIDSNAQFIAEADCRLSDGVLSQPSWINRGTGYRVDTSTVTITGDGFADIIPTGRFVVVEGLERAPISGTQLIFDNIPNTIFVVVSTEILNDNVTLTNDENQGFERPSNFRLRLSPILLTRNNVIDRTGLQLRRRFSNIRITGHDFLDIGTGNFEETNYPEIYKTGLFAPAPENEAKGVDGGRVFYTSTDQLGNFRTGELFSVEQATGVVTISAEFFDLGGLSELRLGGIRVGGTGAVIREFSTDPTLAADSNNVVATQRAIAAFIAQRLTIGGSEVAVPRVAAGTVRFGPAQIDNTFGFVNIVRANVNFDGTLGKVRGTILAQQYFYRSFFEETGDF